MSGFVEIYGLYDPDSGDLRYVGKAINAEKRLKRHVSERHLRRPVCRWIKSLIERGKAPQMKVLLTCPFEHWEDQERRMIALHRETSDLLNLADGGAMPSQTIEQRRRAARMSHKAQSQKQPREILFIKAKQDMARLLAQFTRQGDNFHAYVMRFFMRAYYASDPKRHATWANL